MWAPPLPGRERTGFSGVLGSPQTEQEAPRREGTGETLERMSEAVSRQESQISRTMPPLLEML
jgi:hypothetical protein